MWIREVRVAPLMDRFSNSLLSNEADLYSHQFPQTALAFGVGSISAVQRGQEWLGQQGLSITSMTSMP